MPLTMPRATHWGSRVGGWLLLGVSALGCGHREASRRPPTAAGSTAAGELTGLVSTYHETGAWEPLREWVDAHPDDPRGELWREVVALRMYEAARAPTEQEILGELAGPEDSERDGASVLAEIFRRYPETVAGRMAASLLAVGRVRGLAEPPINPRVVAFLDGDDAWIVDANAGTKVNPAAFRAEHGERFRDRLGGALVADGCRSAVGYCTWWVHRYPEDPRTATLRADLKALWYRRAHPTWRGRKYANCAFTCARQCRGNPSDLDDACYPPCFARCG